MASKHRLEMVSRCFYQWARSHSSERANTGLQHHGTFASPSPLQLLQLRELHSGPMLYTTHGSSQTSQTVLAAQGSTPPSTSKSKPSIVRKLLGMLPGNLGVQVGFRRGRGAEQQQQQLQQPPQQEAEPAQESKPGTEAEKEREEALEWSTKMANMDLDGYKELQQTELTEMGTEPLPALPPVPMWHVDYNMFLDFKRLEYLRKRQHAEIIECMTDEQKAYVLEQGKRVLRNHEFLQAVAAATKLKGRDYMELEVKDCLKEYFSMVKNGRQVLFWLEDLGRGMPTTQEETLGVTAAVSQIEARDWLVRRLRSRSSQPSECALHHARGWAGSMARCEQTDLPYAFCCGGKPMPIKLLEVYKDAEEEGVSYDSREFKRRLEAVLPVNRFTRRPKPLNHLLPPREGSPRLEGYLKQHRGLLRKKAEPTFEKTIQSYLGSQSTS